VELLRLNNLIEFVICHPTIIKRNKNTSAGMELVMQEQQVKPTPQEQTTQSSAFLEFSHEK
jgi:hypothetical protein